eukprot:TRINITY_DN12583_c0_g1_i2.p1 TRINITY_DN12583_c0_g1~~TRINITY_DN12583_c0_g1_i2.p1  ORF type:complete len:727 (-),score=151.00 TRINITY_DN12583_c0_g1_i2:456-2636(-)
MAAFMRMRSKVPEMPLDSPLEQLPSLLAPSPSLSSCKGDMAGASTSAEAVLRQMAPTCHLGTLGRMRRDGIRTVEDLASLNKDELKTLGLNCQERTRIMQWCKGIGSLANSTAASDAHEHFPDITRHRSGSLGTLLSSPASTLAGSCGSGSPSMEVSRQRTDLHLDEVEKNSSFWLDMLCHCPTQLGNEGYIDVDNISRIMSARTLGDVRENILEQLVDLTSEHVAELFDSLDRDLDDCISTEELMNGFRRCGLPVFSEEAVEQMLEKVIGDRQRNLRLAEFESILSRLKLAQVLGWKPVPSSMSVVDYNTRTAISQIVKEPNTKNFFFGHRPNPIVHEKYGSTVRWVHLARLDAKLLMALTVKYSLHPLSVEDVLEQCPSKLERLGENYFAAVQRLSLMSAGDGSEAVRVSGQHVSAFFAGAPNWDTMITLVQEDQSYIEEWPTHDSLVGDCEAPLRREATKKSLFDAARESCEGAAAHSSEGEEPVLVGWAKVLRDRLEAQWSRIRERKVDFLFHQIIDLCTDDILKVTKAYTARLQFLEKQLNKIGADDMPPEWSSEVSLMHAQLHFVARRVSGMQRMLRRALDDMDLVCGSPGYFTDISDHLIQASDDCRRLSERCHTLSEAYERGLEKAHERARQASADRLNNTLYVLTAATAIFAPVQFMAGVYGMNFVNPQTDDPSIPELLSPHGYRLFWEAAVAYLCLASILAVAIYYRMSKPLRDRR